MRKFFLVITLILISEAAVFSQQKPKQHQEYVIPVEIQTILLEAGTLQPELTVDIYLRVISSGKIESKSKKKQLLEEIFYLSSNVKEKVQRKIIAFDGQVLTIRPTFVSNAQMNKLDALSLKTRIVSEMFKIDRIRAFELFNEISPDLTLESLSCQDFLLYEISNFYDLVGEVAKNSFTRKQINQGQRIVFLSLYLENITSSSQLLPIVKMLSSIDLTDDEKFNLVSSLNKSIKKVSGDDRSFSYEMNFGSNRAIYEFSRKLFFSPPLHNEFLKSYRDYLVKNLQGTRCQDNVEYEKKTGKVININEDSAVNVKLPAYVYQANKYLLKDLPISTEETKPDKVETVSFPAEYFTQSKASQIFDKFRQLRDWEDENKTISETKKGAEWQEAFSELLDEIDEWKKSDAEYEIDLFHQKSLIYRLLLKEAPTAAFRETIVRKYLKLLNQKEIQKDFVAEWFLEFNNLRIEIGELGFKEEQKIIDALENSNNSAVRLYLDLEKILKSEKTNTELNKNKKGAG